MDLLTAVCSGWQITVHKEESSIQSRWLLRTASLKEATQTWFVSSVSFIFFRNEYKLFLFSPPSPSLIFSLGKVAGVIFIHVRVIRGKDALMLYSSRQYCIDPLHLHRCRPICPITITIKVSAWFAFLFEFYSDFILFLSVWMSKYRIVAL